MPTDSRNKSAAAKKATMGAGGLHDLMPPMPVSKSQQDFADLIKRAADKTSSAVRVEYRVGRGWLISVGGIVIGDVETDPIAILGEAVRDASK